MQVFRTVLATNRQGDLMDIIDETKRILESGDVLDRRNFQKYQNFSKAEIQAEIERIKNTIHLMSEEEFEDAQSKLVVLNKLLGR